MSILLIDFNNVKTKKVNNTPKHYIFAIDDSGSMATKDGVSVKSRWENLIDAFDAFVNA